MQGRDERPRVGELDRLGVAIEQDRISVVGFQTTEDTRVLVLARTVTFEPETPIQDAVDSVVEAIEFEQRACAVAIDGRDAYLHSFSYFEGMPAQHVKRAARLDAERHGHFKNEPWVVATPVAVPPATEGEIHTCIAIVRRESVDAVRDYAQRAGLEPVIDYAGSAYRRALPEYDAVLICDERRDAALYVFGAYAQYMPLDVDSSSRMLYDESDDVLAGFFARKAKKIFGDALHDRFADVRRVAIIAPEPMRPYLKDAVENECKVRAEVPTVAGVESPPWLEAYGLALYDADPNGVRFALQPSPENAMERVKSALDAPSMAVTLQGLVLGLVAFFAVFGYNVVRQNVVQHEFIVSQQAFDKAEIDRVRVAALEGEVQNLRGLTMQVENAEMSGNYNAGKLIGITNVFPEQSLTSLRPASKADGYCLEAIAVRDTDSWQRALAALGSNSYHVFPGDYVGGDSRPGQTDGKRTFKIKLYGGDLAKQFDCEAGGA